MVLLTLLGSSLVNYFFREFFGRPRPFGCLKTIIGLSCFSFPSGHATGAAYFYGMLDYLIFRFLPMPLKSFLKVSLGIAILVILVGLSRIFLTVHYPSDIIGGFFLGGAWLILGILLIDILY